MPLRMRAMQLRAPAAAEEDPFELVERLVPEPVSGEVRAAVEVCGACRTDLHVAEGDLAARRPHVIPGHQVVGRVAAAHDAGSLEVGQRVGVAWLNRACGSCRFCARDAENLCMAPSFTGWDRDGGFAEFVTVPAEFAYPLERANRALVDLKRSRLRGAAVLEIG